MNSIDGPRQNGFASHRDDHHADGDDQVRTQLRLGEEYYCLSLISFPLTSIGSRGHEPEIWWKRRMECKFPGKVTGKQRPMRISSAVGILCSVHQLWRPHRTTMWSDPWTLSNRYVPRTRSAAMVDGANQTQIQKQYQRNGTKDFSHYACPNHQLLLAMGYGQQGLYIRIKILFLLTSSHDTSTSAKLANSLLVAQHSLTKRNTNSYFHRKPKKTSIQRIKWFL